MFPETRDFSHGVVHSRYLFLEIVKDTHMSQFEDYLPNIAKAINRCGHSDPITILQYFPDSYAVLKHKSSRREFCEISLTDNQLIFTNNHEFYNRLTDLIYKNSFKHYDLIDDALTWFLSRATYYELPIKIAFLDSQAKTLKFDNIANFKIEVKTDKVDFYTIHHIIDTFISLDSDCRVMLTNLKRGNASRFKKCSYYMD